MDFYFNCKSKKAGCWSDKTNIGFRGNYYIYSLNNQLKNGQM